MRVANRLFGRRNPVDIMVTTYIKGEQIAEIVTRHQQRRARTNAIQRRGPREGATLTMDDDTRQKIQAAFEALQANNYGTALDILWRLLGYDSDEPAA